jgi:hypothetical protein
MIPSMNDSLSEQTVREVLTKLLTSQIFARSERLGRFLQFTVDQVLAGKQSEIKEYVIGVEVYDRRPSYNPAGDSIVRTEARRLRGKLKQYYEVDGKTDPVRIVFRPGSYIPEICLQEAQAGSSSAVAELSGLPASTSGELVISVNRFVDLSATSLATICARVSGAFLSVDPDLSLEGDIRQYGSSLRVTCRLNSAEGFQLVSYRLDVSAESAASFRLHEGIAVELVSRITAIVNAMTADPPLPRGRMLSMVIPGKRTVTAAASS